MTAGYGGVTLQEAQNGFHGMDGVVEFVHAHGGGNVQDLTSLLLGNGEEAVSLVGVAHGGGAQDHLALGGKLLQHLAVLQIAHQGLIDEHGNARLDKGHGKLDVAIPVTALDKGDVHVLGHLGKIGVTLFDAKAFHEVVDFLVGAEAVVVDRGVSCGIALQQNFRKRRCMGGINIDSTDSEHISLLLCDLLLSHHITKLAALQD